MASEDDMYPPIHINDRLRKILIEDGHWHRVSIGPCRRLVISGFAAGDVWCGYCGIPHHASTFKIGAARLLSERIWWNPFTWGDVRAELRE